MSKPATASPSLNGYTLTNHFRRLRLRWDFTPLEAYLFFELVALCNDEGWPEEFSAKNSVLTGALGCSEPGLIKARKTLASAGLISYVEGQNRRPTAYRLCPVEGSTQFSLPTGPLSPESSTQFSLSDAKHLTEGLPEFSIPAKNDSKHLTEGLTQISLPAENDGKHLTEGLTEGLTEFSPYIEQTKTKINTARRAASGENDVAKNDVAHDVGFDAFWDAFAKKTDRVKSAKAWARLTLVQRRQAFAAVPAYVAATPELRYRKNPLTWLNGQCWLDEGTPAAAPTPAPGFSAAPVPAPRPVDARSVLDPEAVAANAADAQAAMRQRIAERRQRQAPV